ncbi:cartilage intermediate layer protein 1 [Heterodontus francisci]|uniref:cartilage intermediate layer protein 1 n=1 Tax=Heterodontus francisci TaxID=7792 RepID=UPI00355B52FA
MHSNWATILLLFGMVFSLSQGHWAWTSWFNVDHPGGSGDYERLDAIQHYYRERICPRPAAVEARTIHGVPATHTGEAVHLSPRLGFWCLNKEQLSGKHCSNYAVRFRCPKRSISAVAWSSWSQWSVWGPCTAACEQTGVQIRRRTCSIHNQNQEQQCPGPLEEGRMCKGPACEITPSTATRSLNIPMKSSEEEQQAGCELRCTMGRVNAECSRCMCEEHLLYGSVHLQDGAPASKATVHLWGNSDKVLTVCDTKGKFRIPGLCPDGKTALKIKKAYYGTAVVTLSVNNSKMSTIEVKLKRSEKPYIRKQPVSKVRHEGQSVTFCCKVLCNPPPDKYFWYHNGSLLDVKTYGYDSTLMLRQLQPQHAGQYLCQASNTAGSIKSQPATLTVIALGAPSCNPKPESHLIQLPYDCYQNLTQSFYYNVGKCPVAPCAGEHKPELRCKDTIAYCCGAVKLEERKISCIKYVLPIKVVSSCGCQKCVETRTIVRGRAVAADNGEPMRFGQIFMSGKKISMTGYRGTFSIQVPADIDRFVLTFVDRYQKFVNTTKILPFNKKGGSVFHEIKLVRKRPAVILDCSVSNTISLGATENQNPIAELEIPPNSFYRQNGDIYRGLVKASVTFLDPRDISSASAAQSDLNFINEEGDVLSLRTYGMFSLDFMDEAAKESLNAGQVKVFLDSVQVKMPEHLEKMKLWSLNPETGFWEEEGDFTFIRNQRGKREERTFLVGNMEIRERRLFNLDVPESRRCYVKVRTFRGDRFMPSDQTEGVVVSLINLEPMPGFSSNPRAWGRFDSTITGSNGACLPAFCDDQQPNAYSAYVMATLGGEELEAVASSPKMNSYAIGVEQSYLNKLQYRRSDHEDAKAKKTAFKINVVKPIPNAPDEMNGPIYSYENLKECEEASFNAGHFRFYRVEGDRYDYNTVAFNEDDPLSWTEDYLAWWPRPLEFRACYIKVKISGPQEITVRSRNMGGTHPRTVGEIYGIRDVRSTRDKDQLGVSAVCLEFKCSGMLFDQERIDRTLVKVIPQDGCYRESVNNMLREYLVNHLPLAVNNDTSEFTMLAPLDPLGHNYGIYTVTDQDPRTAKEIALGRCFDGSSDSVSRVMKSNQGVALTFNCNERPMRQQSVFQSLQNSPGQSIANSMRMGREKRGRGQRDNLFGLRLFNRLRKLGRSTHRQQWQKSLEFSNVD